MTETDGPIIRLGDFLPYRLSVLSNRISGAIAHLYDRRFNLTILEWRVMAILAETPEISAGEVAQRAAMDKVAVSRTVRRLLEAGHIQRHFDDADRRRSILGLSEKGRRVYAEVAPATQAYETEILERLSSDERAALDRLLHRLMEIQDEIEYNGGSR